MGAFKELTIIELDSEFTPEWYISALDNAIETATDLAEYEDLIKTKERLLRQD